MMIGSSKIARSPTRVTIDWKVDRSPISGMNCFGRLSRDSGQTRVPEPPHMITGWILAIETPLGRRNFGLLLSEDDDQGKPSANLRLKLGRLAGGAARWRKRARGQRRRGEREAESAEGDRQGQALRDRPGRERRGKPDQRAEQRSRR